MYGFFVVYYNSPLLGLRYRDALTPHILLAHHPRQASHHNSGQSRARLTRQHDAAHPVLHTLPSPPVQTSG